MTNGQSSRGESRSSRRQRGRLHWTWYSTKEQEIEHHNFRFEFQTGGPDLAFWIPNSDSQVHFEQTCKNSHLQNHLKPHLSEISKHTQNVRYQLSPIWKNRRHDLNDSSSKSPSIRRLTFRDCHRYGGFSLLTSTQQSWDRKPYVAH